MAKTTSVLNAKALEQLQACDHGRKLVDGGSLYGRVHVHAASSGARDALSISVRFVFRYKADGRSREIRVGTWRRDGELTLAEIRKKANEIRADRQNKVDPADRRLAKRVRVKAAIAQAQADEIEANQRIAAEAVRIATEKSDALPLRDLVADWLTIGVSRKDGNKTLIRTFNKDILTAVPEGLPVYVACLGDVPLRHLSAGMVRSALKSVVERGAERVAVILFRDLTQMLNWALTQKAWRRLLPDGNVMAEIQVKALVPNGYDLDNIRKRHLSTGQIRELAVLIQRMKDDYANAPDRRAAQRPLDFRTECAIWIALSTGCRIGELIMTRSHEVDREARTWTIPAKNRKLVGGEIGKTPDLVVSLSDFAFGWFEVLLGEDASDSTPARWLFPAVLKADGHLNVKTISKQVGDRQHQFKLRKALKNRRNDNSLVLKDGGPNQTGEWTPHDLRRTAATMMQAIGVPPDFIDFCQGHVISGKTRRSYMQHVYQTQMADAWTRLGAQLEAILSGGNVITLQFPPRGTQARSSSDDVRMPAQGIA